MPLFVYYGEQRSYRSWTFAHSFLLELRLEVEVLGHRVNICAPIGAHRLSCTPITYRRDGRFTFCQRLILSVLFIPAILVGVWWRFSGIFISLMNDGAEHVYLHIFCIWWLFGHLWWHIKTLLHFSALLKLIIENIYLKCPTWLVLYPCDKSMWRIFTLEKALFPASFLFQTATLQPPGKVGPICYWWLPTNSIVKNECFLVYICAT